MRRTKIIATIGPKTESADMMRRIAHEGMNIARLNMSHAKPEWTREIILKLKDVSKNLARPIGIMLDTQGPEIRTSDSEFGLEVGDDFKIAISSACDIEEGEKHTFIDYRSLLDKVSKGDTLMLDNGLIAVKVVSKGQYHINCKVLNKGSLGKKKSVNLPGIRTDLPSITQKDREDISIGAKLGIDFVAQSFVRKKEDVLAMRRLLGRLKCDAMIIAKIEDQEGVENMDEIIHEADGIMVARGDLGVEIPIEQIPAVQQQLVEKCIAKGKPVIVATHLLESMIENPRPTRAEVTDVANAVFQKADCIMLSGETTKGLYPLECIRLMHNVAKETQKRLVFHHQIIKTKDVKEALTMGACINAENLDASAIIVFSKTGKLLSMVSKRRPNIDIFVFTEDNEVMKKLMIFWGAMPYRITFRENFDQMVKEAIEMLKKDGHVHDGDRVVIISDVNPKKNIDILEIREV
jgi:pyruvate kinase